MAIRVFYPDLPQPIVAREWACCEICGRYRPLEEIAIGQHHRMFVCDDCVTDPSEEVRWFFETEGKP